MKFPPGTGGLISRHQKYSGREVTRGKEGKEKGGKEGGGGEASLNREKQESLEFKWPPSGLLESISDSVNQ